METTFEEFSVDIDESRGHVGPPVNLFNVDMKYQSIDFTTEPSTVEQNERAATPPPPPLDIFDFDLKYTEDPLQQQSNITENLESDTVVSAGPMLQGIDFTSFSVVELSENKPQNVKTSIPSNDVTRTVQNPMASEKSAGDQDVQKSVLMESVLQKIKTTLPGNNQTVKAEQQVTEIKSERIQESSAFSIEKNTTAKSSGDSDDEFDFDLPASKNTPQNLDDQSTQAQKQDLSLSSPALRSHTITESFSPVSSEEKQPSVKVVPAPDTQTGPTLTGLEGLQTSQGTPALSSGSSAKLGQSQTVSEIGNAVLKQVCENGEVSETFHVKSNAEDEWDKVQTIEAGFVDENETRKESVVTNLPLLSFYEMSEHFGSQDFSGVKDKIRTSVERHGFSALKHFLFGPPKLHRDLHEERDRIFCIAASVLENSDQVHVRSLQTIYRSLTGSRFDCPRYGNHWEEIGFQGRDPSTDLRGVGLLGLLHLLYLLRDAKRQMLADQIYKLSLHPTQNFPFCVMSINLSRIALQALREGCLNKECNKQKEVLPLMSDFYTGLYLQMYQMWKSQGKTIADSGFVLQHIENHAKRHPQTVLKNLEEYLYKKKSAANLENVNLGEEQFTSVVDSETAGHY
ncbi:uncharacterized protein LOC125658086 [Ostrea edulis]|uniref:uncharacterized protein LOC125658086 n=1 Tax=Ostrea edulis TaxID=37623 RepID=UPI002095439B|nr:uncharacterized protein LOC125658086 [Ostrea edulis]